MARLRTLVRRARDERGVGLVEMITVLALMGIVMMAVVVLDISGVRAQANMTSRFNAETMLHTGLDRMRKDIHVACSETAQSSSSITLSEPPCDGTKLVTWCTSGSGSAYGLYRIPSSAASCTNGQKLADYLTSGSIFTYTGPDSPTNSWALARVHLDITVNSAPAKSTLSYHVVDNVAFGNSARCVTGSTC
jgi:Prokaryotic N-terminal methylation motif